MRHVSLFTGVGGFDLAFKQAGHESILMCEIDPGCQQVLKQRFPGVLLISDIASLVELPPETEIVSSGFPCIDLSRAGLRAGIHLGQSSGLVRHVFRLLETAIRRNRPVEWVVFENVEGILDNTSGGEEDKSGTEKPAIQYIVDALEALGYGSWSYRVVASACTGIPNRRKRLFIVAAWSADARDILLPQGPMKCQGACTAYNTDAGGGCFECYRPRGEDINIAMDLGNARSSPSTELVPTFTTHNRRICLLLATGEMGNLRIEDAERLQGFPEGWTEPIHPLTASYVVKGQEDASDKVADASAAVRYRAIANAVTVPVAQWIGRRLARPRTHRFLGNPSDIPLQMSAQTREAVDTFNQDGDPGVWESHHHSLLPGRTTAQRRSTMQAQCDLWDLADHAVCAAQERDTLPPDTEEDEAQDDLEPAAVSGTQVDLQVVPDAAADAPEAVDAAMPEDQQPANTDTAPPQDAEAAPDTGTSLAASRAARKCTALTCARIIATSETGEKAVRRIEGGVTYAHAKLKGSHKGTGWRRAAWWVRGGQRFFTECSDAPIKAQLKPLHKFIHTLGPMPPLVHLHTYISRMKEKGWNVWRIVKKALDTGHLEADLCSLLQMPDQNSTNKECIGWLVFAPFLPEHPTLLWPSEAVDPLCPPKGRKVPQEAYKALSKEDYDTLKHLQQQSQREAAIYGTNVAVDDIEDQQINDAVAASMQLPENCDPVGDDQPASAGNVADGDHAKQAPNKKVKRSIGPVVRRAQPVRAPKAPKVLVNLFSTHKLLWMDRSQLLDYNGHQKEQREKAEELRDAGKLPHARLYDKAVDVADSYLAVQKGIKGKAGEAAKAQTAADAAAQINNMPPCKKCEACIANMTTAHQRRCLRLRAYASAAAGHAGAQVAVMEDQALGARLEVWWAQEEQWYAGTVSAYLDLNVRHQISYDDGDVEIVPLWAPNQMIKQLNRKHQFAAEYKNVCEKNREAQQAAAQHKEELRNGARMAATGSLTALEQARQAQLQRNMDMMKQLVPDRGTAGLTPAPTKKKSAGRRAVSKKPPAPRSPTPKKTGDSKQSGSTKMKCSKTDVVSGGGLPPLPGALTHRNQNDASHGKPSDLVQLLTEGVGNDKEAVPPCVPEKFQQSVPGQEAKHNSSPGTSSGGPAKPGGGGTTASPGVAPHTPTQPEKQTHASVTTVVSTAPEIPPLGAAPVPGACGSEPAVGCNPNYQTSSASPAAMPPFPPNAAPSVNVKKLDFPDEGAAFEAQECPPIIPPPMLDASPEHQPPGSRSISLSPMPPQALLQKPVQPTIAPQTPHTQHAVTSSKNAAAGLERLKRQNPHKHSSTITSAMDSKHASKAVAPTGQTLTAATDIESTAIDKSVGPAPPSVQTGGEQDGQVEGGRVSRKRIRPKTLSD